ncbi:MAG: hypothetical protein RLY21_2150 [Planctomycetota bacterium]|jgi:hypothetical protein
MKIGQFDIQIPKPSSISKASRSRKIALALVTCVALLIWAKPMGLLLWARIRILTSIPKTAIAEPVVTDANKPTQPSELDPKLPGFAAQLRDPFSVDDRVFPKPKAPGDGTTGQGPATPPPAQTPETEVGGGDEPKDDPNAGSNGEGESTVPAQYEALRASAETIRVQSAGAGLLGAVIENKAVRLGETVTSPDGTEFTLIGVLDGAVVLGRDGREFVVRMPTAPEVKVIKPAPKSGGGKP